ncbi:SRPBCC family protein [Ectobacillus antri]|jgi:ligand-binding SRPBCC domain-containing protein|uniref:SRPBCC family protein n=1 Tax=Ectobacillus antri TaxID=2486280 RepID=A0ABT6H5V0_9BACI|nr:SRPBCC family protein [Ectobacillus antri]MDG4657717.1 SRPBCC family protein [Ectobacillus antri]MDG5754724.1 SRPBCC family protein [Ectobacillus antri]
MKQWTREITISAPIETVWRLFEPEHLHKIMPQVVSHIPVTVTEEEVGSIYRQQYKEGSRVQEYDVETLAYENKPHFKRLKVGFTLANMFEITAQYDLEKMDVNTTKFTYTATNKPLKWFVRLMLFFASETVVTAFTERVKQVAEAESKQ